MVENNYDKNNNIKMVYIEKANYFVPDFLAKNFENIPAPIDFYEGYSHREEIPFWWTRDVALPLTSKENRKAKKEALNILRALEMQGMQLELANKRFLLLLQKQEREHKKRCEMLNEQTNQKLEELKVLSQNNKLEYQNKLMELELELQNINMEKAFYEREKANLFHLEEQSEQLTESHLEWQEAIAAIDEEILESKERSETVKIKLHNEYKEKGLLASAPSYEKKINDEKRQKLPDTTPLSKIKLESFDKRNILEVKHLYLTSRDSGQSELLNIDFNVKKREITIVHSKSERVRIGILSAIMRTLPSNIQISNGDIMLGGESVSESLHDEYRKRIQKLLVSSLDIEDIFARSNKKLYKAFFSNKISKEILEDLLRIFDLDARVLQQKLNSLDESTKRKLAIAVSLSMQVPLTILLDPEEDMSKEEKECLAKVINTRKAEGAILILSGDKKLINSLRDTSLYSFNQ